MASEFEDKIRDDLAKAGMLSELLARKAFEDAGWSVRGPGAYFDREVEKSREGDFYATSVRTVKDSGETCVHSEFTAVAEVKKSERPWIVFKRPLAAHDHGCAWNNLIARVNLPCSSVRLVPSLSEHSLLKVAGWEGAGIHEAFKSPDQPSKWYSAFVSSLKWAYQMRDDRPDSEEIQKDLKSNPTEFYFFQPVVVLDGRLFSAELDKDSNIQISEISSAPFRFSYESKFYEKSSFRVDLVTVAGLREYVELLEKRHRSIVDGIAKEAGLDVTGD
jgi:hypothetical protein